MSQNRRVRPLSLSSQPWLKQEHSALGAQDHIQAASEGLQGEDSKASLGSL